MTPVQDQLQRYLARVVPWPEDGGKPSFVGIHWTFHPTNGNVRKDGRGRDLLPWAGRACRSVSEAVNTINFAIKNAGTKDIYLCMGAQREALEQVTSRGYHYYKPIRNQENIVSLKSLFLDIDFKGGDHGYDTPDEAIKAIGKFLKEVELPYPSMVVSSGRGLHVYWTIVKPLNPHEWIPLAYALAEATKVHGLKCDTQCTIDSSRVLRIPGTLNYKSDPPKPVKLVGQPPEGDYLVERLASALEPYKGVVPVRTTHDPALPPRTALEGVSDLAAGIDTQTSLPVDLKTVIPECKFIRDALVTGGKDYTNPLWNLTTLISTFCGDARAMAHLMGRKHPGYSVTSTDELFDRKEREKEQKRLGWPHCTTISGSGCKACQTCPHFPEGKSPLNFGKRVIPFLSVTPQPSSKINGVYLNGSTVNGALLLRPPGISVGDLPKNYLRDPDGIILKISTNEDGITEKEAIAADPMTLPWLQRDPWMLNFTTKTDREQQVSVPFECIGTNDLRKVLNGQGMVLHDASMKPVQEFFMSWIDTLKSTKSAVVSAVPFGWNVVRGKLEGFVYGGSVWTPTGPRLAPNPDPIISNQYSPTGEEAPWIEAAQLITSQGRSSLDALLASSFGAPLVRFTNQSGLQMSVYSQESGIGKSTALKIALAVWGDPIRAMQSLSDTSNSVINKIGEIRSLPLFWDELKTEDDTRRMVDITFRMSLGKEKSRLNQSAKQRSSGTWQTLLVTASNESLLDFVTNRTKMTTAGLYRIFEYEVAPGVNGQIAPSQASRIVGKLHDNYGIVGLKYAKFLGENFARVDKEVGDFHKELDLEVNAQADERFWTALVTCICMGAKYSNELGFTTIDEVELKKFMLTSLGNMRGERAQQPIDMKNVMNVSNVLAQFLNAARTKHTLTTNRVWIAVGKPIPNAIKVLKDPSKLDGVYVHIGVEDKIMRISSTYLSDWLTEKGYSRHLFTKALSDEFSMKRVKGRIGSGTVFANATEYLLEIDLAGTVMANFIDEV